GLPTLSDPTGIAVHRIINTIIAPAVQTNIHLRLLLIAKLVHLSIEYGNSAYSAVGYGFYGIIFAGNPDGMEIADRMSILALTLTEQVDSKGTRACVDVLVYALLKPWREHLASSLDPIRKGIQAGIEVGDIEWAGRLMCFYNTFASLTGRELNRLDSEVASDNEFLARHGLAVILRWNACYRQFILNLLSRSKTPHLLAGEGYDETLSLEKDIASNDRNFIFLIYMFKLILAYVFGKYRLACECAEKAEAYLDGVPGMIFISILPFYRSLALLAVYPEKTEQEQKCILDTVSGNQKKIEDWAEYAPMNHLHRYWLVEAERARVLGQDREAGEFYDRAIELAREHRYVNEEALANERAGYFYENRNRPRFAEVYVREAYRLYEVWGAKAKTDDLATRYPAWVGSRPAVAGVRGKVDTDVMVRVNETFSSAPIAGEMLRGLMEIVMENAGAQRGLLLLRKHGRWVLEAEAETDPFRVEVLQSVLVEPGSDGVLLAHSVVQYVVRTRQNVLLDDAAADPVFGEDPYIRERQLRSLLGIPILHLDQVLGLLVLENGLTRGVFSEARLHVLNPIASQMAVSLAHALQYEEQVQQFGYLYRLRSALGEGLSGEEMVQRAGEILYEVLLNPGGVGVQIEYDGRVWSRGESDCPEYVGYSRPILWGGRKRGALQVFSSVELDEPAKRIFLDETAGQLSRVLEARDLQMQLFQTGRLVALGEMAAGVAHELNQPLTAIVTTAGDVRMRLAERVGLSEAQLKEMMGDVVGFAQRMAETVDHLRVFSRETPEKEGGAPFEVNECIRYSLKLVGTQLEKHGVELDLELGTDLLDVVGHSQRMEQVFLNLLGNARDALDEREQDEKRVSVRTFCEEGWVVAEVSDNGVGIEVDQVRRVFDPFFTTKGAGKGTGLGLSISYAIVKEHGGEIVCESVEGEGTLFRVRLPGKETA
ncbi:MAG: ATP-binding protein, partial [bacterium]|nr:ATP-binding protein [bacterium]